MTQTHILSSLDALYHLANQIAGALAPGDVVALEGPLGSGKTTLTQAIAKSLGVQENVTSPSFVLINEYQSGRIPLVHADLYRLGEDSATRLAPDLLSAIEEGEAVVLVEWAHYGPWLNPYINVSIRLDYLPENPQSRRLTIETDHPAMRSLAPEGTTEDLL